MQARPTLTGRKQVLSNSGIASISVVLISLVTGGTDRCLDSRQSTVVTALIGGVIGHYACCNGDTWSSELGILSKAEPRIITTFKVCIIISFSIVQNIRTILFHCCFNITFYQRVRKGTNGGVTMDGLLAAAAAGFSIGLAFVLIGFLTAQCAPDVFWRQLLVIPLATAAGLCGSLIDSFLGATVQYSGYCSIRKKVLILDCSDFPTSKLHSYHIISYSKVNVCCFICLFR
jgi:uncharacterized membrane protein